MTNEETRLDFVEKHAPRALCHYVHAKEKHPYFCDGLLSPVEDYESALANTRRRISAAKSCGMVSADDLIDCELLESFVEIAKNNTTAAVVELYDAIAVLLRTIDVLEGRQQLGKPETKGEAK